MHSTLLGALAAMSGILYAISRFFSVLYVQRLRESLHQAHFDWQQSRRRLEALQEKLQVARSRKTEAQQRLLATRSERDKLYARLRLELPLALRGELEKCLAAPARSDPEEAQVLRQLGLEDKIAKLLSELSFLIVESSAESPAEPLLSELARVLEAAGVRFYGPAQNLLICVFDQPEAGFELFRAFVHQAPPERVESLRAALYTGFRPADQEGDFTGVISLLLQRARQLLSRAPAGALLLDQQAYRHLEQQGEAVPFDQTELLHVFSWRPAEERAVPAT